MKTHAVIAVTGIVQGVGFRPFVYKIAKSLALTGYVLNLGDAGVRIVVEGEEDKIDQLLIHLSTDLPSIARIDSIKVEKDSKLERFSEFTIASSSQERGETTVTIPPDIAICDQCVSDIMDYTSRWYNYPFTSCAACGPRYSTITDLPYDRPNTTMADFPLCNTCMTAYTNVEDRRFHAQTIACNICGPRYRLTRTDGSTIQCNDPIESAAKLIRDGKIVVVHGVAGTHIVTKTTERRPILELRHRKKREQRPFAIMVRDSETVYKLFAPTDAEMKILTSWRRPIVLLKRHNQREIHVSQTIHVIPEDVFDALAPGLDTIGVMLPYAPVHHLLFKHLDEPALVMTSANPTGIPMYIEPKTILTELADIADAFLLHNRRISQRADDSVIKFVAENNPVFIRRSRGYVPDYITLKDVPTDFGAIAVGAEERVSGAILKSRNIYMTQHIGDTDRLENIRFLSEAINHIRKLVGLEKIQAVACDLHPEMHTTEYAETVAHQEDARLTRVQHHHSHLASLLADHALNVNTSIVCIIADGYGYGSDGTAWGGEILMGDGKFSQRIGGLAKHFMPGGDLSAKYPIRALIGYLYQDYTPEQIKEIVGDVMISPGITANTDNINMLINSIVKGINTFESSSAGRFLDAVSVVLGVCSENTYDGECPMKLEAISRQSNIHLETQLPGITQNSTIKTRDILEKILDLKKTRHSRPELAYVAQSALGHLLAEEACRKAEEKGIKYVGFSGGVALNRIITRAITQVVQSHRLTCLLHRTVPPGDGGIAVGQLIAAVSLNED